MFSIYLLLSLIYVSFKDCLAIFQSSLKNVKNLMEKRMKIIIEINIKQNAILKSRIHVKVIKN